MGFPTLASDWQQIMIGEEGDENNPLRPAKLERCFIEKNSEGWFRVKANLAVDGDGGNGHNGTKPCYAPRSYGKPTLDDLPMAGHPGNWWGVVTNNGRKDGTPILQGSSDPAPGAYISQTAYHLLGPDGTHLPDSDPNKYLDSGSVPFIVLPLLCANLAGPEIVLGCMSWVRYKGAFSQAVVGDKGPTWGIGEGSPKLCSNLGVNPSARNGGVDEDDVWYYWKPGQPAVIEAAYIEPAKVTNFRLQRWREA